MSRNNFNFKIQPFNTIFKERESVSYLDPKTWNKVPEEI